MKFTATKFYTFLFVIVVLAQLYLPSFKVNVFLQLSVLALYFFFEKATVNQKFFKIIAPLIVLFLLGFLGMLFHRYSFFNISKDIFHFIKPITGMLIGYFFYKKINDFKKFVHTIVVAGFASAIIHFGIIFVFSDFTSVNGIRELARDNFLELFSLFFLVFYKKFQNSNLFKNRTKHYLYATILTISCILYFSRTMIVVAIILLLSVYGYTYITRKGLKIIMVIIILIAAFYSYLFSVKIDRNQQGLESFLFKIKNAPSEIFKTKINRYDHKDLWDHWRGYEAKRAFALMQENPSSFVFGNGYGSLVNLKFFAPLTDNSNDKGMKFISELHNGFAYILYKTGVLGLIIYLCFLIQLYKIIYDKRHLPAIYISGIGLVFLFTTLTITGIYNARDIIVFILGGLLFFESNYQKELT
jgi:O-antigen ligase